MRAWLKQLDNLLRGKSTGPEQLASGCVELPLKTFMILALLLGATYGFFMGWFSIGATGWDGLKQLGASTIKLPLLFLLTLAVTFPSLYVFNALIGCRLDFISTLRLLVAAIVINLAVAASLGPILGFFTVSTESYTFMVLLNVLLLGIAGCIGLGFLFQTLRRLSAPPLPPAPPPPLPTAQPLETPPGESPALRRPMEWLSNPYVEEPPRTAWSIFRVWLVIYALVGAQMGWILRPFIGSPNMPFQFFRHREGNFFQAVVNQLSNLVGHH